MPEIIDVIITGDSSKAMDVRKNTYKIESIMLGVGSRREAVPYKKHLRVNAECRAEILENGKLKIIG